MENIRLYLRESYDELINHVTWPTWDSLFSSARLVVISTILIAIIIFIFDLIAKTVLQAIYSL